MAFLGRVEVVERLPSPAPSEAGCSVAVGTFDGVHLAHRALVRRAVDAARAGGLRSCVLTFEPHPGELLGTDKAKRLSTPAEKLAALAELAPERVVVLPFDRELAGLTPAAFARRVLAEGLAAREVHVGHDFSFGRGGVGRDTTLVALGRELEFSVQVMPVVARGGAPLSSTRIRGLLQEGLVEEAAALLGRPYRLCGRVARGEGRGRALGFPTANVELDPRKLVPRFGVYVGRALGEGLVGPCLVNVGMSPTFGPRDLPRVEAYIPGVQRELYGVDLALELTSWLRPEVRFATVDELVAQMRRDVDVLHERTGPGASGGRSSMREGEAHERVR